MLLTLVLAWLVTSVAVSLTIGPMLRDRRADWSVDEIVEQWPAEATTR